MNLIPENLMMLRSALSTAILMLAIASCSDPAPPAPQTSENDAAKTSVVPASADAVAVQLGMVFVDGDPTLMGGALIVRGRLSVGDLLEMMGDDGRRVDVRIDAIKDDASAALVSTAKAPAGVFLTFTADHAVMTGSNNLLVAKGSFPDFESAQAFVAKTAANNVSDADENSFPTDVPSH